MIHFIKSKKALKAKCYNFKKERKDDKTPGSKEIAVKENIIAVQRKCLAVEQREVSALVFH